MPIAAGICREVRLLDHDAYRRLLDCGVGRIEVPNVGLFGGDN